MEKSIDTKTFNVVESGSKTLKHVLAESLKGRTYNFKCSCILPIDDVGTIKDYEIVNNEILFIVDFHGKIIRIGENHPNMVLKEI